MDIETIIDIVLCSVYVLLAAALGVTLWAAIHGVRTHEQAADALTARRVSMTGYLTAGLLAVTLLATYLLASTRPIVSNGHPFTDVMWLRLSDMFIFTSLLLIGICSIIVVIAKFRR